MRQCQKHTVREIQEESIRDMVEAASRIFEDPDMVDTTVNFGYMLDHLKDNEFPEAFISGWKIVEKHIAQKWKDKVGSKPTSAQRDSKRHPAVSKMLQVISNTISSQSYETFMDLKDIRNEYMHENGHITKQQAQKMLDAVKNYILEIS